MRPSALVQQDDVGSFFRHQTVHLLRLFARFLGAHLLGDVVADAQKRGDAAVLADGDLALRVDDLRGDVRIAGARAVGKGRPRSDRDRERVFHHGPVFRRHLLKQPFAVGRLPRIDTEKPVHAGRPIGGAIRKIDAPIAEARGAFREIEMRARALKLARVFDSIVDMRFDRHRLAQLSRDNPRSSIRLCPSC